MCNSGYSHFLSFFLFIMASPPPTAVLFHVISRHTHVIASTLTLPIHSRLLYSVPIGTLFSLSVLLFTPSNRVHFSPLPQTLSLSPCILSLLSPADVVYGLLHCFLMHIMFPACPLSHIMFWACQRWAESLLFCSVYGLTVLCVLILACLIIVMFCAVFHSSLLTLLLSFGDMFFYSCPFMFSAFSLASAFSCLHVMCTLHKLTAF